jgi:predicted metal-dependent hydrolase
VITVVQSKYEKVLLENRQMFIYTSSDDLKHKREIVMKWLDEMRETTFSEMLRSCFEEVRVYIPTYPMLQIKNYRSRWGCCYATRNIIILNEKLIHLPVDLIRYIIIHELTHLRYPNHGNEFHAFIRMFVPDEQNIRRALKKYSVYYE